MSESATSTAESISNQDLFSKDRPWGCFEILDGCKDFKVKRLEVNPGKRTSLQAHRHRSEYWVVVRGMARVTVGEEIRDLEAGEMVRVPVGAKHRLENSGDVLLVLIEVQLGDYFGEDDIVRYEDDYHRPLGPLNRRN